MQKTHVDEAASSGKHGLLQWLHDTGHGIFPDRKSRLGAVSHIHPAERNANGRHVDHLKPAVNGDHATFRECGPDLWETLRWLPHAAWRHVHGAGRRRILPGNSSRFRRTAVLSARRAVKA